MPMGSASARVRGEEGHDHGDDEIGRDNVVCGMRKRFIEKVGTRLTIRAATTVMTTPFKIGERKASPNSKARYIAPDEPGPPGAGTP